MLRWIILTVAFVVSAPDAVRAQSRGANVGLDCADFELESATVSEGLPKTYTLNGLCMFTPEGPPTSGTESNQPVLGLAIIEATWDDAVVRATELVTFAGGLSGTLRSAFQCTQDPFIFETPCLLSEVTNDTPWPLIDRTLRQSDKPLMSERIDPAQALELARRIGTEKSSSPNSLAGPKPLLGTSIKDSMARQGQGILEAESLVASASSQGRLAIQRMPAGATTWSNNAQLYWQPETIGSLLTIPLTTNRPGEYVIKVHVTSAPEYGLARLYIHYRQNEGQLGSAPVFDDTPAIEFDGYAPQLTPPQPVELQVPFTDGAMQLVISVPGKNSNSSGLAVGIDRIELGGASRIVEP